MDPNNILMNVDMTIRGKKSLPTTNSIDLLNPNYGVEIFMDNKRIPTSKQEIKKKIIFETLLPLVRTLRYEDICAFRTNEPIRQRIQLWEQPTTICLGKEYKNREN
jgi:hypothetical protein